MFILFLRGHLLPHYPFLFWRLFQKSRPCCFYTHFFYSLDDNIYSKNYFRLSWSILTLKCLAMKYCHNFFKACKIVAISFSYVDFTKYFPLNCLHSKSNGLPSCVNTDLIHCPNGYHSNMIVLDKSCIASTGVEVM